MENTMPENSDPSSSYRFTLAIDPATISSAQQKKVSFRTRRIFTNPRIARTKKLVALLARPHRNAVRALLNGVEPISLQTTYHYAYPKGTPKKRLIDGCPRTTGGDIDNIHKAVQDALGCDKGHGADLWDDDRRISTLLLKKRFTTASPRISFVVMPDSCQ